MDATDEAILAALRDDALLQKDQVFGVRLPGGAKAWPLEAFAGGAVINDRAGLTELVLVGDQETRTVRAYRRDGLEFMQGSTSDRLVSKDGVEWVVTEGALTAPDGRILDRLPGVSVQSNDAFGANEESQTISLRGFDKSRLGYTLDGIPLGDNSYGNYNGLSIARAIIAENLAGAELSQGIGSLGVASTSNLGGTIQYFSMDPSTEFGGRASVTVGDDSQRRGYLRVDTGDINGFSAYVSGVHQDQDMWAAPYQNQTTRQFNAKAVWNVGDHRFGAFVATSRASQANYAYLSKDMLARGLGYDWNIYAPDWDRAVAAAYCAPGTYNKARCAFSGGANSIDDAYYQSRALREDNLYSVDADLTLGEQGRLKLLA